MTNNPDFVLIKICAFRPFPHEKLHKIVEDHDLKKLIILEISNSLNGMFSPFSISVLSTSQPLGTLFRSFIVGLGQRDVTRDELDIARRKMAEVNAIEGRLYMYLGVRETKDKIYSIFFFSLFFLYDPPPIFHTLLVEGYLGMKNKKNNNQFIT